MCEQPFCLPMIVTSIYILRAYHIVAEVCRSRSFKNLVPVLFHGDFPWPMVNLAMYLGLNAIARSCQGLG